MGFAAGFKVGRDAVSDGQKQRELREMREGIKLAMEAKPEQSVGFTAEQGAELEAAARRGDKVDVAYKDDGQGNQVFDRYVITPAVPQDGSGTAPASRDVAMQGVTDFMGQRTAGAIDDARLAAMRNQAVVNAVKQYDPVQGFSLQRQLQQDEREGLRFGREKKQWEQDDAYQTERKRLIEQSPVTQANNAYSAAMQDHQAKQAAWEQGGRQGPAPVAPAMPDVSPAQRMLALVPIMQHDFKYGKTNAEGMMQFDNKFSELQKEGYFAAVAAAHNGADAQTVARLFNASGKVKIPPGALRISDGKDAAGMPTRVLSFVDESTGETVRIDTASEAAAIGKLQAFRDDFFKSNANERGNQQLQIAKNADARAGASAATDLADKKAKADAAVALFKQRTPNATTAELEAVRRGIIDINPGDKNAPSEVKLAQAMVDARLVPDMRSGLERAITKKSQSAKEAYLDLMKPQGGIAPREEDVAVIMETAFGGEWRNKVMEPATPPKLDNVTDADIKATAKKYGVTEDEVRKRLKLQ